MEHLVDTATLGREKLGHEKLGLERQGQAEALAALRGAGERPEELAHDARNMVTALELYCGLLEERGVLSPAFAHYSSELRLVAAASRRLVERLSSFETPAVFPKPRTAGDSAAPVCGGPAACDGLEPLPSELVESLAAELELKRNLLCALAGPGIEVRIHLNGGALPAGLTREDLTRVLVNLVKNAVEAMPEGGEVGLTLDEFHTPGGGRPWLVLKVEDTGPGIPADALEAVFLAGYTTRGNPGTEWRRPIRRGLGLSITQAIVESAGGRIFAANRHCGGARFEIELPVRAR